MYEFKVLSDTLRTSLLPSPFDGIELRQEIAGKIIDSIGWAALCTPESFCSLTFIAAPLVRMMEQYLQDVFTVKIFFFYRFVFVTLPFHFVRMHRLWI